MKTTQTDYFQENKDGIVARVKLGIPLGKIARELSKNAGMPHGMGIKASTLKDWLKSHHLPTKGDNLPMKRLPDSIVRDCFDRYPPPSSSKGVLIPFAVEITLIHHLRGATFTASYFSDIMGAHVTKSQIEAIVKKTKSGQIKITEEELFKAACEHPLAKRLLTSAPKHNPRREASIRRINTSLAKINEHDLLLVGDYAAAHVPTHETGKRPLPKPKTSIKKGPSKPSIFEELRGEIVELWGIISPNKGQARTA